MPFLNFSVDSALLRELGEKLVETVHLALVELVKNCYDADATKVEIIFKKEKGKNQIHIIDNGVGMNFKAVDEYWMRIATTNKNKKKHSPVYGRPLTGAKGIGRFSCRRLGGHLKLITCGTKDGKSVGRQSTIERTEVLFPWTEFAPGTDVTRIQCPGIQENVKNQKTGTTLIISDISDEWTTQGFNWLKRQLAVLAANRGKKRKGFSEDLGFNVSLVTPSWRENVKDLREELLNAGWGTLTCHINEKHQAVCELDALEIGKKKLISSIRFNHLKNVSLKLAIMVDDKDQLRNKKVLSLGTLKKILDDWGGVQVRYKGFRVYPYGDDDWLDIDNDRGLRKGTPRDELFSFAQSLKGVDAGRSLLNMLSMKSYVGNVEIDESSPGFDMKANREGFLSSPAVDELKQFTRFAIHWATILRDFYIRQRSQKDSTEAKGKFEEVIGEEIESGKVVDAAVEYLENEVKSISRSLAPAQRRAVEKSVFKATDAIRKYNDSSQAELAHLRIIASTSTLLLIFSHEVKSLLGLLEESKNSLDTLHTTLTGVQKKEVKNITHSFSDLKDRLGELLQLTSLIGVDQRKNKPGQVALKEKVIKVVNVFKLITSKYHIEVDYSNVPNSMALKNMLEAEVYSILLNGISNSIKAVIAGGKTKKIQLEGIREKGQNIITIKDSGIGLDPENYEEVFVPFISDPDGLLYKNLDSRLNPEDSLIVGSGSGLGLGIIREIITAHGGSVKFKKPAKGWNTELEIRLP